MTTVTREELDAATADVISLLCEHESFEVGGFGIDEKDVTAFEVAIGLWFDSQHVLGKGPERYERIAVAGVAARIGLLVGRRLGP